MLYFIYEYLKILRNFILHYVWFFTYNVEIDVETIIQETLHDIIENITDPLSIIDKQKDIIYSDVSNSDVSSKRIKIGLLTNEIPPIVYGGVATWIVNFIEMFKDNDKYEIIPIFLESVLNDRLPEECYARYKNIRVIKNKEDIHKHFSDINICVNNLWIALDTIHYIKYIYDDINIITVCHSLIRMENITNMGSCYTNNFNEQEKTFALSDTVVLISKSEEEYYKSFNYDKLNTNTYVIYNSYKPKYDNTCLYNNYESNILGYIGRHVPRKRPEIPIISIDRYKLKGIKVVNMGVDYDKYGNYYWKLLEKKYKENLEIIPFTTDKDIKEAYWNKIGINCITGIYEPFGYTICECLDRRVPVIVSNIDGPKEIIEEVSEYVYKYEVDLDNYERDIQNFTDTLKDVVNISPSIKKYNAHKARKALDKLRPEKIVNDWIKLFETIKHKV